MSHINSSFSDDGNLPNHNYLTIILDFIGRKSEEGKVLSTQVEYSDRGKGANYFYEERISE